MSDMSEAAFNSPIDRKVISGLSLFSGLSRTEFDIVANVLRMVHIKKGDSIFKEGDTGKEMYVLLSGAMSAYRRQSDGNQRRLFEIRLGDFFGEMSIIEHEPRSATISATEDSWVIMFREVDFYRIIAEQPLLGFKLLRVISIVQNQWLDQMSKSYNDLIRWGETARRRAITDEMTGLYNRRFLEESIKERFLNQSVKFRVMCLLMMDLDRIHGINDCHGTKAGDLIIIAAADMIRSCLRPGDIPARLSGDEFAILLPDTDEKGAARVAERIRENIEKKQVEVPASPGADESVLISTRASIGISAAPFNARNIEELIDTSDTALRKAKELGRNRVEVYSKEDA